MHTNYKHCPMLYQCTFKIVQKLAKVTEGLFSFHRPTAWLVATCIRRYNKYQSHVVLSGTAKGQCCSLQWKSSFPTGRFKPLFNTALFGAVRVYHAKRHLMRLMRCVNGFFKMCERQTDGQTTSR